MVDPQGLASLSNDILTEQKWNELLTFTASEIHVNLGLVIDNVYNFTSQAWISLL